MSKLIETEVEVDVERLDSETIDDHLRSSTEVLKEILQNEEYEDEKIVVIEAADGHACRHCGKLYKTASTLHMHSLLKHPENKVEVRCCTCDKKYASLMSLQKHVRYMHRFPHRCSACYRTFETQLALAEHGTACFRYERPCPTCGKMYDSMLSLRNHIKYKHPGKKTNWCDICRRTFYSTRSLANHYAAIHPDGTTCIRCDKKFNSMTGLQSHYLYKHADDGERCNVCKKVFGCKRSLLRHIAKNHNGENKKYSCGICEAKFQGSQPLIEHVMELHTNQDNTTDMIVNN